MEIVEYDKSFDMHTKFIKVLPIKNFTYLLKDMHSFDMILVSVTSFQIKTWKEKTAQLLYICKLLWWVYPEQSCNNFHKTMRNTEM